MMSDNQWLYHYLLLAFTPYIGPKSFINLLQKFKDPHRIFKAHQDELIPCLEKPNLALAALTNKVAHNSATAALQWQETNPQAYLLTLSDALYPTSLLECPTPPPVLFLHGNIKLLNHPLISIVGSRRPTPQAIHTTKNFAQELATQGYTIVSGLAKGIDSAAHTGALQTMGSTIAILGTGIDRIYPPSNKALTYQIAEEGLLISEFPLGTQANAHNFPRRNRIIAALGQATVVMEANIKSGSLITARLALEMGKEVMALPNSIYNPMATGCHKLIQEGAKLITCPADITEELLTTPPQINSKANSNQNTIDKPPLYGDDSVLVSPTYQSILEIMGFDPIHPDELSYKLNIPIVEILQLLLQLELASKVTRDDNGQYQRLF